MSLLLKLFDRDLTADPPNLVDVFDIYSNLRFSTQLHGGFGTCSFVIPAPIAKFWEYHRIRMFYRLTITDTQSKTMFEGRLEDTSWTISDQLKLTFYGYYSHLGDFPSSTDFNTTSDAIIKARLTEGFPDINSDQSNIDSADITIQMVEEDEDLTLMQLLPKIAGFSDTSNNTFFFAVWEDRLPFYFARSTSSVDWFVNLDDFSAFDLRLSTKELWNAAYVEYDNAGQTRTSTVTNAASIAKYEVTRTKAIVGQRGVAQAAAEAKRDWWVAEFSELFPETDRMVVTGTVTDSNGVKQLLFHVRAGEVLRIRDLIPTQADLDTVQRNALNTFFIRQTTYDQDRNSLTIIPDNPSRTIEALLMRDYQLKSTRAISRI